MEIGYFARAAEDGHNAKTSQVHILKSTGLCLCGYRPHKTMQFQWCGTNVHSKYVECKKCIDRYYKRKEK